MREILTIQVGGYANFVGSHFWNFQDEILGLADEGCEDPRIPTSGLDMDALYRVGETRQRRPTYTPRLLSIDLRGSSGSVSPSGTLYGRPPPAELTSISTWHGPAKTFKAERYERNEFLRNLDEEEAASLANAQGRYSGDSRMQNAHIKSSEDVRMLEANHQERALVQCLENGVQFSTDYLKVHLHPSSTHQIPGVWQGVTPFGDYGCGRGLISGEEQSEEIRNKIRFFVEECDHMQGFNFIVDDSGGFSALAADLLEDTVEEYGRSPIFLFTVRPPWNINEPSTTNKALIRSLHDAVSLGRLASVAHVTVPLGLPQLATSRFAEHLCIKDEKHFHTSAVYAAAINCITLPFRMEVSGPSAVSQVAGLGSTDMGTSLRLISCSSARRVALMEAALPAPALPDTQSGRGYDLGRLSSLTPSTGKDNNGNQIAEMLVIQGAQLAESGGPATAAQVHGSVAKASDRMARAGTNPGRGYVLSHMAICRCPLAVPLPFPCIFSPHVGKHGEILSHSVESTNKGLGGLDVTSSPMAARVSTSSAILPYIRKRWLDMRQLGLARSTSGPSLMEDWGFAREETQELSEVLSSMLGAYGDEVESGSDSQ